MSRSHESPFQAAKTLIQKSGVPGSSKNTLARLRRPSLNDTILGYDTFEPFIMDWILLCSIKQLNKPTNTNGQLPKIPMQQNINSVINDSTCNYAEAVDQNVACS